MATHPSGRRQVWVFLVVLGLVMATGCAAVQPSAEAGTTDSDLATSHSDDIPALTDGARRFTAAPPSVTITSVGTLAWAFLDRATGQRYESPNGAEVSYTESMVKAWLAADDLVNYGADAHVGLIEPMLRDSDDDAAESIYLANGADDSIARMISTCGLVDTQITAGWWSKTLMSARDAVTLGACLADGTAAGEATQYLLSELRQVRGEGRFGVVDALDPVDAGLVALKNGWTMHWEDGLWRVNCLGIHPDWIIAVREVYPMEHGLDYGAALCAGVTTELLAPSSG